MGNLTYYGRIKSTFSTRYKEETYVLQIDNQRIRTKLARGNCGQIIEHELPIELRRAVEVSQE
jgi:hypothetical protein